MNAKTWLDVRLRLCGGLLLGGLLSGCQQPHYQHPYHPGMPVQQYGQPQPYGQPMPQGQPMPYGQPMPGTFAPGVSSVPSDGFYSPSPTPAPGTNDAPPFGSPQPTKPPSGANEVPRYNDPTSGSPYFEQSSNFRQEGQEQKTVQAPQTPQFLAEMTPAPPAARSPISNATFAQPEGALQERTIDLTAGEQFQQFEPPIEMAARPESPPQQDPFASADFASPAPPVNGAGFPGKGGDFGEDDLDNTFMEPVNRQPKNPGHSFAVTEPQPMDQDAFELAAPPVNDAAGPAGDAIEGTVKYQPETESWVLVFAAPGSSDDPFGGKLPLTGKPALLQQLKEGQHYRVQGFIEAGDGATIQTRFHVQQMQHLGSPFARPE